MVEALLILLATLIIVIGVFFAKFGIDRVVTRRVLGSAAWLYFFRQQELVANCRGSVDLDIRTDMIPRLQAGRFDREIVEDVSRTFQSLLLWNEMYLTAEPAEREHLRKLVLSDLGDVLSALQPLIPPGFGHHDRSLNAVPAEYSRST
jgi:hypothetical protein